MSFESLLSAIATILDSATYLDAQVAQTVIEHLKPLSVSPNPVAQLSPREMEVLHLMVEGLSNTEIAARLGLSTSTVKGYMRNILNKLVVDDRVQAAVVALRSGLV